MPEKPPLPMSYAAFHFYDLALHAQLAHAALPSSEPAALLSSGERQKSHLIAVNHAARQHSLLPGLLTTRALARCPHLHLLDPDPTISASAQRETLAFIDSLVPDFERTTPDTFLLDLSTLLIPSLPDWVAQTQENAETFTFPVTIGLGQTPDLAHLASLTPQKFPLKLTFTQLSRNPPFPLPPLPALRLWGVETLDQFAQLPRQGLSERLGPEAAHLHDVLHAKHHRLLRLHRPCQSYHLDHSFEPPLENHEPLLFMAKRLLQTLCNRLRHHHRAAAELQLHLAFENGSAHARRLTLSEPTLSTEPLLRSLHTHLDHFRAPARITEFHLALIPTLPRHAQHELFHRGLKDPNQFSDTLRRLSELVGPSQIGIPQLLDTHRPDAHTLTPFPSASPTSPKIPEKITSSPPSHLPLNRQRPPLPIHVASEKLSPFPRPLALLSGPFQGPIRQVRGPFPLSGSWWENPWQEAQWDVALDPSLLIQITFHPPQNWLLSGIYG